MQWASGLGIAPLRIKLPTSSELRKGNSPNVTGSAWGSFQKFQAQGTPLTNQRRKRGENATESTDIQTHVSLTGDIVWYSLKEDFKVTQVEFKSPGYATYCAAI